MQHITLVWGSKNIILVNYSVCFVCIIFLWTEKKIQENDNYVLVPEVNGVDCRGNLCQMLHKHYFSIETHPGKCEYELLHKVFPRDHSTFGSIAGGYLIF